MRRFFTVTNIIYLIALCFISNSFSVVSRCTLLLIPETAIFLFINIFAGAVGLKSSKLRLKVCGHGVTLLCIFVVSAVISVLFHIALAFYTVADGYMTLIWSAAVSVLTHAVVFWNGIICVYCTSVQLGIKTRIIGVICGMVPIANLVVLSRIISVTIEEVTFEADKEKINLNRQQDKVCATKYPLLLVHGVFFRDSKYFNYWGRIPKELEANGAAVYYGNHQSAASVCASAKELAERIKNIVKETGCEKVNIIAHSKGGLDCRYAISELDAAPYVASLTTVNTPHQGCGFADYLLKHCPVGLKNRVADTYNSTLKKLGDTTPDFLAAVNDLTAEACAVFDTTLTATDGIYCQSIGSKLNRAAGGKFPLNFSYHLVKFFDGANDGLVSESSFKWGENYTIVTTAGTRGVSHGDMIDLNRENIRDFDVREFYVDLVHDLKNKGL